MTRDNKLDGIPTAENARNLTNDVIQIKYVEIFNEIGRLIHEAIQLGKFEIECCYESIDNTIIDYLRNDLGYNVTYGGDQRDGYYYRISWR